MERKCSYARCSEFEKRERDLIYAGWQFITVIREILDQDLEQFRQYIDKTIELAEPHDSINQMS